METNRGPQLTAISITFGCMALITTLLRCYVRGRIVKAFGGDDAFMVAAMLVYVWYTVSVLGGIHYGTGRHMSTLSADSSMNALRYWWMCYLSYGTTMTLAKISIGLFLLRVTVAKIHRWIITIVMGVTVVTGLIFLFITLFQCKPVDFFWTKIFPDSTGSCIDIDVIINVTYIYGSICAVCDFTFGLLPIALVWNLVMDRRTKIVLIPILGMACIASAAVIVRMPYIRDFKDPDFLYATVDIAIWSTIEPGLAITAGSLATLRPLFRLLVSHFSNQEYATETAPGNESPPGPSRDSPTRRKRLSLFPLSTFSSTKCTSDIDLEFASTNTKAYKLEETNSLQDTPVDANGRFEGDKRWDFEARDLEESIESPARSDQSLSLEALPPVKEGVPLSFAGPLH